MTGLIQILILIKPRKSGRLRSLRYSMLPALMNGFENNERFLKKSSKIKIRDENQLVKFFVQKLNTGLLSLYCSKFFLFDAF